MNERPIIAQNMSDIDLITSALLLLLLLLLHFNLQGNYIGLETRDGWWVKGIMKISGDDGEPKFLLSKAQGFEVCNDYMGYNELRDKLIGFRTFK